MNANSVFHSHLNSRTAFPCSTQASPSQNEDFDSAMLFFSAGVSGTTLMSLCPNPTCIMASPSSSKSAPQRVQIYFIPSPPKLHTAGMSGQHTDLPSISRNQTHTLRISKSQGTGRIRKIDTSLQIFLLLLIFYLSYYPFRFHCFLHFSIRGARVTPDMPAYPA